MDPQDGNQFGIVFNLTFSAAQRTIARNLVKRHIKYGARAPELPGSISPSITSLELRAQLFAGETEGDAASPLALLRSQWGHATNGSCLHYGFYPGRERFISHAHGWSTGPVFGLLADVVGLRAGKIDVAAEYGDWVFQPSVKGSGLRYASGGFLAKGGLFEAQWSLKGCEMEASIHTPKGLKGTVYLPTFAFNYTQYRSTLTTPR